MNVKMSVVLELPSMFARYAKGQSTLELDANSIKAVLDDLRSNFPELAARLTNEGGELFPSLEIFIYEQRLPKEQLEDHVLADGDRLELVTLASGG